MYNCSGSCIWIECLIYQTSHDTDVSSKAVAG